MSVQGSITADVSPADDEPPLQRGAGGRVRAVGPHLFLSPEQVVGRALQLASARPSDLIVVAGPDGMKAMVALCRAGFERVEFACQSTCVGADEPADLLLIVGPMDPAALREAVRRTARVLRDEGVVVAQLTGPAAESAVKPALQTCGLQSDFTVIDRACGRLVLNRVRRAVAMRRSA